MPKLKSKSDVIEWYWPDFLKFCMKGNTINGMTNRWVKSTYNDDPTPAAIPTIDNFWLWYITAGPMGVKEAHRYYTKENIQYV